MESNSMLYQPACNLKSVSVNTNFTPEGIKYKAEMNVLDTYRGLVLTLPVRIRTFEERNMFLSLIDNSRIQEQMAQAIYLPI